MKHTIRYFALYFLGSIFLYTCDKEKDTTPQQERPSQSQSISALPTELHRLADVIHVPQPSFADTVYKILLPPEPAEAPFAGFPERVRWVFRHNEANTTDGILTVPQLLIYKIADWDKLCHEQGIADTLHPVYLLKKFLSSSVPVPKLNNLPMLPLHESNVVFSAKVKAVQWKHGYGIRYLTRLAQDVSPITNNDMAYTYQGITYDGQYYIVFCTKISLPTVLPADIDKISPQQWRQIEQKFESYLGTTVKNIDQASDTAFSPTLQELDGLIESLTTKPVQVGEISKGKNL